MGPILHFSWRPARQAFSKQVNQPDHMMYVLGLSPWYGYHPQQPLKLKENVSESFSEEVNHPNALMYVCLAFHHDCHYHTGSIREEKCK